MASGPTFNPARGTWYIQWFNGTKWVRTTVTKKPPNWKATGPIPKRPPPEAQAALAIYVEKERVARTLKGTAREVTVREFLLAYQESYFGHSPNSLKSLKHACRVFLEWCDERKIKKLEDVTPAVCAQWLEDRAKMPSRKQRSKEAIERGDPPPPISHGAVSTERAMLAGAWGKATKEKRVPENPWVNTEVPIKAITKSRGSWTLAQFDDLLKVCEPWLEDLLIIGCNTGLRITALRNLEWRDIKFSRRGDFGEVVVRQELDKAGKGYRIPMSEKCHDVLFRRSLDKDLHPTYVLTGMYGKQISDTSITHRAIVAACTNAGLPTPDSPNHHMRRTFGRWAVFGHLTGQPIPLYIVSRWFGHASIAMTEQYLQLDREESARWMESAWDRKVRVEDEAENNDED